MLTGRRTTMGRTSTTTQGRRMTARRMERTGRKKAERMATMIGCLSC